MTNAHDSRYPRANGPDRIGQLVKLAGRRPLPDAAHMARARAAAHHEWSRIIERRTWRLSFWSVAAAAIAAGVLTAAGWFLLRPAPARLPGAEIAMVQTVTGSVQVTSAGERPRLVTQANAAIRERDRIDTNDRGRAALTMAGISIRLDRETTAVFDGTGRIRLDRGAVYVDAQPGAGGSALHIDTSFGVVRHTGTQFEVRLDGAVMQVRVREGSVAVETSGERLTSPAGEALVLARGNPPQRRPIAASGPEWDWVVGLAQPFRLEGATAAAFLSWVSREQGWRLDFDDGFLRARLERTVLHGSIDGLTPEEALAAVLPTSGLTSRLDGNRLLVSAVKR